MADLHDEGITPHIQVHDELDCSFEDEVEKDKILEIMRNAVKLEVPVKLDVEEGPSWGQAVKATLCPNCSYEHVIVPMFKQREEYFCLLCRKAFKKRVNGGLYLYP